MPVPYTVAELLNQNRPVVNSTIDLTLQELNADGRLVREGLFDSALLPFISSSSYSSREVAWLKVKSFRPRLGHIRGTDGEIQATRNPIELTKQELGSINISDGVVWKEADYEMLDKLRMLGQGIQRQREAYDELLNVFLQRPADLILGIEQTWLLMALRTIVLGNPSWTDPRSGIEYSVDYTNDIPAGHLAAAKTGTGVWSDLANATGIADLVSHLNVFYETMKMFPDAIAMSRSMGDNLRNQDSTKILVARNKGIITDGAAIADASNLPKAKLEDIQDVIATEITSTNTSMPAPRIILTDAVYNDGETRRPFMPQNYYTFLCNNMVEAARVPTLSAIKSRATGGGLGAAGYTVISKNEDDIPAKDYLKVDSAGMILCPDPRKIASRKVEE